MPPTDAVSRFDRWFKRMCNGDWEHTYGVTLQTVDNPGWMLEVELTDTPLVNKPFITIVQQLSSTDWLHCAVSENLFRGSCGVGSLDRLLVIFLDWADPDNDGIHPNA